VTVTVNTTANSSSSNSGSSSSSSSKSAATAVTLRGDVLIGADGRVSPTRLHMLKMLSHSSGEPCPTANDTLYPLAYRGYTVYRGIAHDKRVADTKELPTEPSFQTWGGALRFAGVPLKGGYTSWFATVQQQQPLLAAATSYDNSTTDSDSAMSLNVSAVNSSEKQQLVEMFRYWHSPVGQLINSTAHIGRENALAFST
jgi:2-polyprenyl-6-methoxyphenol hydroxylase-like FAD-dependent oxidoreductase